MTIILLYWLFSSGFCIGLINFGTTKYPMFNLIACIITGWFLMPIIIGQKYTKDETT
jgi:hypothetical protein